MTSKERIDAAISLNEPDRVPVAPFILFFAARHAEVTMEKFIFDRKAALDALVKTFDDLGGWDAMIFSGGADPMLFALESPLELKLPGKDLPPDEIWQAYETEQISRDEYDVIAEKGWNYFLMNRLMPRVRPGYGGSLFGKLKLYAKIMIVGWQMSRELVYWQERGVPCLIGSAVGVPFETLTTCRSFGEFFVDLMECPERIVAAMDGMLPDMIEESIKVTKKTKVPGVSIGGSRGAGEFMSLEHFERYYFPWFKKMVEAFHEEGIISLLHFDSDWTANLSYFKDLPKGSCILELDGKTDIFKAKEILGGHICIMGDVPASLLTRGTPQDVEDYCRKLIDVVGRGGGFILSSGCEVPSDAKFENVKAMIDSVRS